MKHLKIRRHILAETMKTIIELLKKRRSVILYLAFGICTTLINWTVYPICYYVLGFSNMGAVCAAWFIAVTFAFVTNKIWVFERKNFLNRRFLKECISFFSCRLVTGTLDLLIMYVAVDVFELNAFAWKILSNGLVVILNYATGKFVVFRKDCIGRDIYQHKEISQQQNYTNQAEQSSAETASKAV